MIAPVKFNPTIADLDKSGRTADGTMVRDRIAIKRKFEVEWGILDQNTMADLLHAMADVFFTLTYFDALENKVITKNFYAGDRNLIEPFVIDGKQYWKGLKTVFVER